MKYLFSILFICGVFFLYIFGSDDYNKFDLSNKSTEVSSKNKSAVQISSSQYNGNKEIKIDECPSLAKLKNDLGALVDERKNMVYSLTKILQENKLQRGMEAFILQSIGLNHFDYLLYKSRNRPKINSLIVTDTVPHILKVDDERDIVKSVSILNLDDLALYLKKKSLPENTIISGKSLLSYVIETHQLDEKSNIYNFIKNSGISVHFNDLVIAVKNNLSLESVREITENYSLDINKSWQSDHSYHNLSTISAKHGRADLVLFWLERGVPLEVSVNGRLENTILDTYASFQKNLVSAGDILEIAKKNSLMPVGYSSYLFFHKVSNLDDKEMQDYLISMQVKFTSEYNFKIIPSFVNMKTETILATNNKITSIVDTMNKCHAGDNRNVLVKSPDKKPISSDKEHVDNFGNDFPNDSKDEIDEIFDAIDSHQYLLKSKKYKEYVEYISQHSKDIQPELAPALLELSLIRLVSFNAPTEQIEKVIRLGAVPSPEILLLISIKNQSKSIDVISKMTPGIKFSKEHIRSVMEMNKKGKITDETIDALRIAKFI